MTKEFITTTLREETGLPYAKCRQAAIHLVDAIVDQMRREGRFCLPTFGTFRVQKTKAHTGVNPRTLEKVKVKAGQTVRFKASPGLKRRVKKRA